MATRHSRDQVNPLKKKFISPNSNRKSPKFSNISPKFKSNLKEFYKHSQGKKEGNLKKRIYEMKKEKRERYHLGGNSSDPLNLNSLINRDPMLSTPQASPHPTHGDSPIDVCYPHHDDDPLNLKCFPDKDLKDGVTPKKKKKKKNKNSQNDIENKVSKDDENKVDFKEKKKKKKLKKIHGNSNTQQKRDDQSKEENQLHVDTLEKGFKQVDKQEKSETSDSSDCEPPAKKKRKNVEKSDSINQNDTVSASIKLPQREEKVVTENETKQEPSSSTPSASNVTKEHLNLKQKKQPSKKTKIFIYGNYNRYYNYRNPQCSEDLRLKMFIKDWFAGKDVLDIGCNVGDITIFIAKEFEPRIIIGNDIDNSLIKIAKSKCQASVPSSAPMQGSIGKMKFPMSFSVTNGPIAMPMLLEKDDKLKFPNNVIFKQENYVPPDDRCLANQKPMYDTILCLSVTKWVHLNWGDQGLKRMFKKIYKNLRPGGRFVLEPQPFASYKKRRKLTEKIRANYDNICFRPEQFIDYLLSDEVGFVAYEVLEEPHHGAPGFRRPIYLFTKGNSPKS